MKTLGKVVELPHTGEEELAAEIEELEVLLSLIRACYAAIALIQKPQHKAVHKAVLKAMMLASTNSETRLEREGTP